MRLRQPAGRGSDVNVTGKAPLPQIEQDGGKAWAVADKGERRRVLLGRKPLGRGDRATPGSRLALRGTEAGRDEDVVEDGALAIPERDAYAFGVRTEMAHGAADGADADVPAQGKRLAEAAHRIIAKQRARHMQVLRASQGRNRAGGKEVVLQPAGKIVRPVGKDRKIARGLRRQRRTGRPVAEGAGRILGIDHPCFEGAVEPPHQRNDRGKARRPRSDHRDPCHRRRARRRGTFPRDRLEEHACPFPARWSQKRKTG